MYQDFNNQASTQHIPKKSKLENDSECNKLDMN